VGLRQPFCQIEQIFGDSDRCKHLLMQHICLAHDKVTAKYFLTNFLDCRHFQNLRTTRPQLRLHHNHCFDHIIELGTKVLGDAWVDSFNHFLEEACHIVRSERWLIGDRFVQNAPQRPNIALSIIRLILPHLRRGIVGRARLRVQETLLGNFADVHVAKFSSAVSV
jgi:hypothetical protein